MLVVVVDVPTPVLDSRGCLLCHCRFMSEALFVWMVVLLFSYPLAVGFLPLNGRSRASLPSRTVNE